MGRGVAAMGGDDDDQKTSWPEVVGWNVIAAGKKVVADRLDVHLEVHLVGDNAPPGYDGERVRLIIIADPGTTIAQTPVIG
ncbi:hypothetical protein BRADI_3g35580v3 [Brachypodium distachyon]|uniref:Uncharacterized protein n=1 Tax=Brachypodium distachyon TaxID=15368 RepID=A0A0Q3FF10_BRADI|nr:hypothetical protein BRADI_3g35580v3 [Brachypodium distachyon]